MHYEWVYASPAYVDKTVATFTLESTFEPIKFFWKLAAIAEKIGGLQLKFCENCCLRLKHEHACPEKVYC